MHPQPANLGAGNVTGQSQFVYVAGAHGALIGDNAATPAARWTIRHLPRVAFTDPQLGTLGRAFQHLPARAHTQACVRRKRTGFARLFQQRLGRC